MARFITAAQYRNLSKIPRGRLATRSQIYCGTIIEDKGKILMVKEMKDKWGGWDFPGGKLLWNENVLDCAVREVLEEGRYKVKLINLLGLYQRKTSQDDEDYFRFIFIGSLKSRYQRKIGDPEIEKVEWFPKKDLLGNKVKLRSPEILRELTDYSGNRFFPLSVIDLYVW